MSFESFTRHCRGTVTSITFTFSFFLLLSLTNFPYQALTMMSPEDRLRQGRGELWPAPPPRGCTPGMVCSLETPTPTLSQDPERGQAFSPILDSSASIILRTDSCISRTCGDQGRPRSGPSPPASAQSHSMCLGRFSPSPVTYPGYLSPDIR